MSGPKSEGVNRPSSLLKQYENDEIFSMLGRRCVTLATSVAQLYIAPPENRRAWKKKVTGVICFVKDNVKRSYFLRMYSLVTKSLEWEQELYNQFKYTLARPYFHAFAADSYNAGLNFANAEEAQNFINVIEKKLKDKEQRRLERKKENASRHGKQPAPPPAVGGNVDIGKRSSLQANDNFSNMSHSPSQTSLASVDGGLSLSRKKSKDKKDSKSNASNNKKNTKKRITKDDIGKPENFQHIGHIGWDPLVGFIPSLNDDKWKEQFSQTGATVEQMQNKETMDLTFDFVEKRGGIDNFSREIEKEKATKPPPPAPPRGQSGEPPPLPPRSFGAPPPTSARIERKKENTSRHGKHPPPPPAVGGGMWTLERGDLYRPMDNFSNMSHSSSQTSLSSVDGGPSLSRKKSKDRKDSKSNASNNKKTTKKRITKDDIGKPENFQHIGHIGWDPQDGFDIDRLDDEWKELFSLVGVTAEQMQKMETMDFSYDFYEKRGAIDNVRRQIEKEEATKSPPPAPPRGQSGEPPPLPPRSFGAPPPTSARIAPPAPPRGQSGEPPPLPPRSFGAPPPTSARIAPPAPSRGKSRGRPPPPRPSRRPPPPPSARIASVPLEIYARGPQAAKAYDNALTGGKTCIKRIPVMLIGQERTGKTSLKKSLKGENFNEKEESTIGIETDSLYFKVSTEIWKSGKVKEEVEFEPEDQFEHLAAAKVISEFLREKRAHPARFWQNSDSYLESDSESELEPPDGASSTHGPTAQFLQKSDSDSKSDLGSELEPPDESSSTHGTTKPSRNIESFHGKLPEEVARLVERMLQEEENVNHEDNIYSVLWDFGGQSVYYETHPIFLTEKAIYILVSDLSRDPEEKAIPPVKTGLFENKVDIDCNKRNIDYLDFWMSSIYSLVSPEVLSSQETASNVGHVLPRRLPPVFLVCTHADVPFGGSNARDLALKMYGFLQCKIYKEHLYEDVFVVDNTKSGSEEECIEVKRLREEVLAVAKELQLTKEEIPLKWLRYENKLRKKNDKWITLEDAKRIAFEDCGIQEDDEFSTLLNFLHDQRIVIHFSGSPELERMVILDPQWLVDVFKNVINVRPFKQTEHAVKDLWIQLEETGILDEKLIDHAWRDLLENQESHKSLIAIMERLCLLSPWPSSKDSKQYLVPSMLMSPPTDDVLQLLDFVNIPSLFVTFASGRVPFGLFSRLILHFLQWCGEEWNSEMSTRLFHNFAMFHILPDQGISVIFWCHPSAIEVALHSVDKDDKRIDISRAVHWKLRFILECMRKEFHWLNNVKYDMCVCCPVCSQPGSVKCRDHDVRGCECLHFLSESDLQERQHCNRPGRILPGDCRIQIQEFKCWFLFGGEEEGAGMSTNQLQALHATSHRGSFGTRGIFSVEGTKRKDLTLPENIKTSIQSIPLNSESDAKDIVIQFREALQLESASLVNPEPETKTMIRGLALRAKSEKRDDLVRHLREITPAGTSGPLLNEDMSVDCMPYRQYENLTFSLSGGEEWKLLAERLGLSQIQIRFLDKRVTNPSDVVLSAVGKHRHLSVGEIYDTLVDCELPAIADLM